MSQPKFTPGPWEFKSFENFQVHFITGKLDKRVAVLRWEKPYENSLNAVYTPETPEETHANAALIAAAPEMYEALRMISASNLGLSQAIDRILARARGES